ncbi:hypothetical protein Q8A67_017625 [Cirrhinus molitorella]|uniref:Uncharacterized protein n=1 Tax=Cirrhinus molitorella TaxID=172907 RepID=A0AA88TH86_9TELE|nr:hypothetical protein Q8A67_017625 [Cirrhinus molitorella]
MLSKCTSGAVIGIVVVGELCIRSKRSSSSYYSTTCPEFTNPRFSDNLNNGVCNKETCSTLLKDEPVVDIICE